MQETLKGYTLVNGFHIHLKVHEVTHTVVNVSGKARVF